MAKLDDFGRPIYETAEEYNRAHKRGSARTYESTHGDTYQQSAINETYHKQSAAKRHATRENSKKSTSKIVLTLITILAANIGVIGSFIGGIYEDSQVDYEEILPDRVLVESGENYGTADTPLPVDFNQFSYDGVICNIPMTFDEVLDATGLYAYYDEEYESFESGAEDIVILYDTGDVEVMEVFVKNDTDEEIPLGECTIEYIWVDNPAAYDIYEETPDFWFGQGIGMESTSYEFEEYLGKPYYYEYEYYDDGGSRVYYEWRYTDGVEEHCVSAQFVDEVVVYITIEKHVIE